MNIAAKVGWWGGAILLAVCTRQALFGVLPFALHWHRKQMAQVSQMIDRQLTQVHDQFSTQVSQMIDQKLNRQDALNAQFHQRFAQLDHLLTQVQQLHDRLDQQPASDSPLLRPEIASVKQSISLLQERLRRLELGTAPQVTDLTAQVDQLNKQVNHLEQGMVFRQGVGVFIDGANLHASARNLGVDLDYATLLPRLLPKNAQDTPVTVHFYSGVDPDNWQQRRLHQDLRQMGIQVHTKPVTRFADGNTKANMDGRMIVDMVKSSFAHVFLLSGDGDFLPALQWLHQQGVQITVAAFAPDTHHPLQQQFPFRDLGKMCSTGGRVIPLPVKQSASAG